MRLPNPICWLSVAWMWLRGMCTIGMRIDGHSMRQSEEWDNCRVLVLMCERCGKFSILWETTARSKAGGTPGREVVEIIE